MKRLLTLVITIYLCVICAWADCTQVFDASNNITIGTRSTKTYTLSGAPIEKITFNGSKASILMTSSPGLSLSTGETSTVNFSNLGTYSETNGECNEWPISMVKHT